jgi:hypothetical protein
MTARTARLWIVLAGAAAVAAATLDGSETALAAGGMLCLALALAVMALDSQRKRRKTRR